LERNDGGANIRTVNVGSGPYKDPVLERLDRIEKLLETINLRLSASPWRPGGGGEIR